MSAFSELWLFIKIAFVAGISSAACEYSFPCALKPPLVHNGRKLNLAILFCRFTIDLSLMNLLKWTRFQIEASVLHLLYDVIISDEITQMLLCFFPAAVKCLVFNFTDRRPQSNNILPGNIRRDLSVINGFCCKSRGVCTQNDQLSWTF